MKHSGIFATSNDIQAAINSGNLVNPYLALYGSEGNYIVDINSKDLSNGHEYIDLGLSSGTLWATCNVGASVPEEYGGIYSWGEITEKSGNNANSWSDYQWGSSNSNITKYNKTDNKTVLDLEDDVAHIIMGGNWHMPTQVQLNELYSLTSTWTTVNSIVGCLFTGTNGNTLFIPAAGYKYDGTLDQRGSSCNLWSATVNTSAVNCAFVLYAQSNSVNIYNNRYRYFGMSVRGVLNL